jgi:hypothetical protein
MSYNYLLTEITKQDPEYTARYSRPSYHVPQSQAIHLFPGCDLPRRNEKTYSPVLEPGISATYEKVEI